MRRELAHGRAVDERVGREDLAGHRVRRRRAIAQKPHPRRLVDKPHVAVAQVADRLTARQHLARLGVHAPRVRPHLEHRGQLGAPGQRPHRVPKRRVPLVGHPVDRRHQLLGELRRQVVDDGPHLAVLVRQRLPVRAVALLPDVPAVDQVDPVGLHLAVQVVVAEALGAEVAELVEHRHPHQRGVVDGVGVGRLRARGLPAGAGRADDLALLVNWNAIAAFVPNDANGRALLVPRDGVVGEVQRLVVAQRGLDAQKRAAHGDDGRGAVAVAVVPARGLREERAVVVLDQHLLGLDHRARDHVEVVRAVHVELGRAVLHVLPAPVLALLPQQQAVRVGRVLDEVAHRVLVELLDVEVEVGDEVLRPVHAQVVAVVPRAILGVLDLDVGLLAGRRVVLPLDVDVVLDGEHGHRRGVLRVLHLRQHAPRDEVVLLDLEAHPRDVVLLADEGEPGVVGRVDDRAAHEPLALEHRLSQEPRLGPVDETHVLRAGGQDGGGCECEETGAN
jgi:hypothetical protein